MSVPENAPWLEKVTSFLRCCMGSPPMQAVSGAGLENMFPIIPRQAKLASMTSVLSGVMSRSFYHFLYVSPPSGYGTQGRGSLSGCKITLRPQVSLLSYREQRGGSRTVPFTRSIVPAVAARLHVAGGNVCHNHWEYGSSLL